MRGRPSLLIALTLASAATGPDRAFPLSTTVPALLPRCMEVDDSDAVGSRMDRLTQLQDAIDALIVIMHDSLQYLSHKSTFRQLAPAYRITQVNPAADDAAAFEAHRKQLVTNLLRKAKQVEFLCSVAPCPPPRDATFSELAPLEAELKEANEDFLKALAEAVRLQAEVTSLYDMLLNNKR